MAFIRMLNESAFFNRAAPFVRWIDGFERYRGEMVFERNSPSGFSCASHRNHILIYLCDASANHALDEMLEIRRAVPKISGLHGETYETTDWIESTLSRKLGNGKNAGG